MEKEEESTIGPLTRRKSGVIGTPDRVLRSRVEKNEVIAQINKRENTPKKEATPRKSLRKAADVSTPTRRSIRASSAQPDDSPSIKKVVRRRSTSVQPESSEKEVTPPTKGKRSSLLPVAETNTSKARKSIASACKPEPDKTVVPDVVNEVKRVTRRSISSPARETRSPARTTRRTSLLKEVRSPKLSPESDGKRTPPNTRRQVNNLNLSPVEEAKDEKLSPKKNPRLSHKEDEESTKLSTEKTQKDLPSKTTLPEKASPVQNIENSELENSISNKSKSTVAPSENDDVQSDSLSSSQSNTIYLNQDKHDSFTGSEDSGIKEMEEFALEAKGPEPSQEFINEVYEDQNNDPNCKHHNSSPLINLIKDTPQPEPTSINDFNSPKKTAALIKQKSLVVLLEDCNSKVEISKIHTLSENEDNKEQNNEKLNNPIECKPSHCTLSVPNVNIISATPVINDKKSTPDTSPSNSNIKEGYSLKKSLLIRFSDSPEKNVTVGTSYDSINNVKIDKEAVGTNDLVYKELDKGTDLEKFSFPKNDESDNDLSLQLIESDDDKSSENVGIEKSEKIILKTSPKIASLKAIFEKPNTAAACVSKIDLLNKSCDLDKSLDTDEIDVSVLSEKTQDNSLKSNDSILQDSDEDSHPILPDLQNYKTSETCSGVNKNLENLSPHISDNDSFDVSSNDAEPHLTTICEENEESMNKTNISDIVRKENMSGSPTCKNNNSGDDKSLSVLMNVSTGKCGSLSEKEDYLVLNDQLKTVDNPPRECVTSDSHVKMHEEIKYPTLTVNDCRKTRDKVGEDKVTRDCFGLSNNDSLVISKSDSVVAGDSVGSDENSSDVKSKSDSLGPADNSPDIKNKVDSVASGDIFGITDNNSPNDESKSDPVVAVNSLGPADNSPDVTNKSDSVVAVDSLGSADNSPDVTNKSDSVIAEDRFGSLYKSHSISAEDSYCSANNDITVINLNDSLFSETTLQNNKNVFDAVENQSVIDLDESSVLDSHTLISENLDEVESCGDDDSVQTEEAPANLSFKDPIREPQDVINLSQDDSSSDIDNFPGTLISTLNVVTPLTNAIQKDLDKSIVSLSDLIEDSDSQQEDEAQIISSEESSSDGSSEILTNLINTSLDSGDDSDYLPERENEESSEADSMDSYLAGSNISGKDFLDDEAIEGSESSDTDESSIDNIPIMHIQQQSAIVKNDPPSNILKNQVFKESSQWKVEDNSKIRTRFPSKKLNKVPPKIVVSESNLTLPEYKAEVKHVGCGVKFSEIAIPSDKQVLRSFTGCGVKFKILSCPEKHMEYLFNKKIISCGHNFCVEQEESYLKRTKNLKKKSVLSNNCNWQENITDPDKIIKRNSCHFQINCNFEVVNDKYPNSVNSIHMSSTEIKQFLKSFGNNTNKKCGNKFSTKLPSESVKNDLKSNIITPSIKSSPIFEVSDSNTKRPETTTSCLLSQPHRLEPISNVDSKAIKLKKEKSSLKTSDRALYIHNLWIGVNAVDIKDLLKSNNITGFIKINLSLCSAFEFLEERGFAKVDFESKTDAQACLSQFSQGLYYKNKKLLVSKSTHI